MKQLNFILVGQGKELFDAVNCALELGHSIWVFSDDSELASECSQLFNCNFFSLSKLADDNWFQQSSPGYIFVFEDIHAYSLPESFKAKCFYLRNFLKKSIISCSLFPYKLNKKLFWYDNNYNIFLSEGDDGSVLDLFYSLLTSLSRGDEIIYESQLQEFNLQTIPRNEFNMEKFFNNAQLVLDQFFDGHLNLNYYYSQKEGFPQVFSIENFQPLQEFALHISTAFNLSEFYLPHTISFNFKFSTTQVSISLLLANYIDEAVKDSVLYYLKNTFDININKIMPILRNDHAPEEVYSIVNRFDKMVTKYPKNIAVTDELAHYTYEELQRISCLMGQMLLNRKRILSGMPVIFIGGPSIKQIILMLTLFRNGAYYVPLSYKLPLERIDMVLSYFNSPLVIYDEVVFNQESFLSKKIDENNLFNLASLFKDTLEFAHGNDVSLSLTDNLDGGYIIFTSGTTGQPKGVVVNQSNVAPHLVHFGNELGCHAFDKFIAHTDISFDVSIEEALLPLCFGAQLFIAPLDVHSNLMKFLNFIKVTQITILDLVPSFLDLLLKMQFQLFAAGLRYILIGGEALTLEVFSRYCQSQCLATLINVYGPTETIINATYQLLSPNVLYTSKTMPIGKPIQGVTAIILNHQGRPIPVGGMGELYLEGRLASKYILDSKNSDKLPLYNFEGRSFYKTGDIVQKINHDQLIFITRNDRQIKILGNRIELDEIERVLAKNEYVKDVVTLIEDQEKAAAKIIAIVEVKASLNKEVPLEQNLMKLCENFLPRYMLPYKIFCIEQLPRLASGKIDYKQIKTLFEMSSHEQVAKISLEHILQEFSIVFEEEVKAEDDFFDLGGDSLLAINLVSKLRKIIPAIELVDIFKYPSPSQLFENFKQEPAGPEKRIILNQQTSKGRLSYGQQRLWYLNEALEIDPASYNISMAFKLSGKLNLNFLKLAINDLVCRHLVFKTAIKSKQGHPWQEVVSNMQVPLQIIPVKENTQIQHLIDQEANLAFDINVGPLVRFCVLQVNDFENIFIITMHNIISDGWSEGVLLSELSRTYKRLFFKDDSFNLIKLPFQYIDYCNWQEMHMTKENLLGDLKYWKCNLKGYAELNLPKIVVDASKTPVADNYKFYYESPQLVQQINEFSKKYQVTPYIFMLTNFILLLSLFSHQEDIVLGTGFSGRDSKDLEMLIGFFVNTVVIRADISGDPKFYELMQRVKEVFLKAQEHQNVPFERVVDSLNIEREVGKNPIFQILFIMQHTGDNFNFDLPDVSVTPLEVYKKFAPFDITFNFMLTKQGINFDIQYQNVFEAGFMENFCKYYIKFLKTCLVSPEHKLSEIHIEDKHSATYLLGNVNHLVQDRIYTIFENVVANFSEKAALICDHQVYSYKIISEKVKQVCLALESMPGVKLIGIYVNLGVDFAVSVLACLKMNIPFLPLDPMYPALRINSFIQLAKPTLILTNDWINYEPLLDHQMIFNLSKMQFVHLRPVPFMQPNIVDEGLCYIIFTSGSTGVPKGVRVSQQAVINLIYSIKNALKFTDEDVFLSLTSPNFDIFYLEIFLPLLTGGTCILAKRENAVNLQDIFNIIQNYRPTFMQATPTFWRYFLSEGKSVSLKNINALTGGERLNQSLSLQMLEQFKSLWNLYGPTETTIWSTIKRVSCDKDVTIGTPVNNTICYVMGRNMRSIPKGAIGEIYIGGLGLSKGYIDDHYSNLFHPLSYSDLLPFGNDIVYKTGDLGRINLKGELEYINRLSQEIKFKGYRIDLIEIESCILSFDDRIKEVAVIVKNNQFLIAFFAASFVLDSEEVKLYLSKFLPIYMIPEFWMNMDELPKTMNYKIDRKMLQNISIDDYIKEELLSNQFLNSNELKIAEIWAEILKLDLKNINLKSSFFILGGHSLLIPQVVSKINETYSKKITIREFIQNSASLERLAHFLGGGE